jgi:carboxymethylenebutenolidase
MSALNITIKAGDGGSFGGYLSTPAAGSGPGVIVLQEIFGVSAHVRSVVDRWAQEGYVALAPDLFWRLKPGVDLGFSAEDVKTARELGGRFDVDQGVRDIGNAITAIRSRPEFKGKVGAVGYCLGGRLAFLAAARLGVDAAVSYYGTRMEGHLDEAKSIRCPIMFHFGGKDTAVPAETRDKIRAALGAHDQAESYVYAEAGHAFNNDRRTEAYDPFAAQLARSRSIGLFRRTLGPRYDLSALWDNHVDQEFKDRDADATIATMTPDAYVNHVPTLTGGYGARELHRFYKNHFISRLPPDTKVVPISRTVGPDRVVDEIIFCFTHDREVDFLVPGVKATGKYVEVPTVVVVEFRGDKLYNEHIYWDQASMLAQLGVLDPKGLPIAGIESAKKARGEAIPSNAMMPTWRNSAGDQ